MARKKYKHHKETVRYVPMSERKPVDENSHKDISPCFCGATLIADLENDCVMHSEPACQRFLDTPLLDFVTQLRRSREGN